jgi:transglutaminase-like putative cysteine protease
LALDFTKIAISKVIESQNAMNDPPLFIPLALAFWGWRCENILVAGVLLTVIALARYSPWRWELDRAQYHRIGDLTAVLILGVVGYFVITKSDTPPVYILLRWLPALFLPVLLTQLYGTRDQLPLSMLFYSLRRSSEEISPPVLDFRLPYACFCLLAAGSGPWEDGGYFLGVALLTLLILWRNRPNRQPTPVWLLLFVMAAVLGYGGQMGLTRLQTAFEDWAVAWLSGMYDDPDPFRARTSIGDVGQLKLSGQIVMRLDSDRLLTEPLLLKEAAYDRYFGQSWVASRAAFTSFDPSNQDGPHHVQVLRIASQHNVLVSVPHGWRGLILPPRSGELKRNRLGAIQWLEAPPVLRYRINYDSGERETTAPTPEDSELPKNIVGLLQPLVRQLNLENRSPAAVVSTVADFFARHFRYSLYLGATENSLEALQNFLYQQRSGHCEYFATATALLLRAGGVPARFIVGYSVSEYSPAEHAYLVRLRHAHAWTEAYIDGAWQIVDNTPGEWATQEAETDPWWQTMADYWSRWVTAFRVWQWERAQGSSEEGFPLWGWLVVPLSLWLAWRLYRSRQPGSTVRSSVTIETQSTSNDAAFSRLERQLVQAGHPPRRSSEPPLRWLRRIERTEFEAEVIAYYRRRYQ